MSLLDNLPHTATATARRRTKGSLGGGKDSFPTTIFTDRACWQQQAREAEIIQFMKRGITVTDKVYFTADPGLNEKNILVVTNPDAGTVTTFEVRSRALPDASAGLGVLFRVMCENTTTGSTP